MNKKLTPTTLLACAGGLGLMPKAPGTWGSLPGLPLAWLGYTLCPNPLLAALFLVVASLIAWWAIAQTEKLWQSHDDKSIVIDEVVGQAVALIWFSPSIPLYLAGFTLFRLFDIAKPGPIGWADRKIHNSFGTLLDDLLAGGAAAALIALFLRLF